MNVSSSMAGRLGVKGQKLGRVSRSDRPSDAVSKVPTKSTSGLGGALAHRLGVPVSSVGSSLSVGIKARLGVGARRAVFKQPSAQDDQFYSPYPEEKGVNVGAESAERRRRNIRTADLAARRGIPAGDASNAVMPARVKMSSGRVVGGMRSDLIRERSGKKKRLRSPSPYQGARPVVAMDATRGLTVRLHNSRRKAPYSQHDDRSLPHAKYSRSLDWDSEEDVGLQFQGGRSHRVYDEDAMDLDSGVDVYNASLLFTTRTTTHHHHHHHHGPTSPSPPPLPPPARSRPSLPFRARSPSPPLYRRDASPRRAAAAPARHLRDNRYLQEEPYYSEDYSPPPPPSPPSFHPRYRARGSPSPSGYTARKATRAAPKQEKPFPKPSKAVKRSKLVKPAKKTKKMKGGKNIKSKKVKQLRSNRSSLDTVSSDSDSSSSSSSSDSSSSSRNTRLATYKAPKERVLPEPHKQVLDPHVRKSIASLQGKDPESKSGPGPGIKDLVFVPSKTNKSLNQRFTFSDASR